jgi:hypothetical protein
VQHAAGCINGSRRSRALCATTRQSWSRDGTVLRGDVVDPPMPASAHPPRVCRSQRTSTVSSGERQRRLGREAVFRRNRGCAAGDCCEMLAIEEERRRRGRGPRECDVLLVRACAFRRTDASPGARLLRNARQRCVTSQRSAPPQRLRRNAHDRTRLPPCPQFEPCTRSRGETFSARAGRNARAGGGRTTRPAAGRACRARAGTPCAGPRPAGARRSAGRRRAPRPAPRATRC